VLVHLLPLVNHALAEGFPTAAIQVFTRVFSGVDEPPSAVFPLQLRHFQALLLFAAIISVAFGFVSRRKPLARLKYILWSFFLFLLIGIGIGWVIYPFSR
jgi:hypothetical protein